VAEVALLDGDDLQEPTRAFFREPDLTHSGQTGAFEGVMGQGRVENSHGIREIVRWLGGRGAAIRIFQEL